MKLKSVIALLLVAMTVYGCGASGGADVSDSSSGTESDTAEVTAADFLDDGLDGLNFDGEEFRIIVSDGWERFIEVEESSGDVVDQAVYERNLAVEERFGCSIETVYKAYFTDVQGYITRAVTSGEDAFDLAVEQVVGLGEIVPNSYFLNWYDIPYINFDKPWWSKSNVEDLTYSDTCFIAIGDFSLSALTNIYCVFYNNALGERYGLPNLYDVVDEGKWTIDYVLKLTRDIYEDDNHNNIRDDEDIYGYVSDSLSNVGAYLWAFDNPVLDVGKDGIEVVFKTEKLDSIITKLVDAFSSGAIRDNPGYINSMGTTGFLYGIEMFAKGKAVLANGYIDHSLLYLRNMDDYTILPYPKWDEAQEEYKTMADGSHTALAIPKTVPAERLEFVGAVTEALNAESYKILRPVYYDQALKLKGTRDEQSIEMLDKIVGSCVYDMGYVYDGWKGCAFIIQQFVRSGNSNFESYWAANSSAMLAHYDSIIEFFEETVK